MKGKFSQKLNFYPSETLKITGYHNKLSVIWENESGSGIQDGVVKAQSKEARETSFGMKP